MSEKLTEKTWILVNRAADLLRSDAFHAGNGELETITISQQNVLGAVYTHPDCGLMVKEIASELNVTRGAVSQTVESLVKLGMLERVHSETDRRAVFVRATPKGIAIRKRLIKRINPIISEVLNGTDAADRMSFLTVLEKLVERLSELNEKQKTSQRTVARPVAMEELQ